MSATKQRPITQSQSIFKTIYSPKSRCSLEFSGQGRTHQSFKDECDINRIMARYMQTGILPQDINPLEARYLDVSDIDFQSAQELVAGARSLFEQMPSKLRTRFENDPAKLLAFVSDSKNAQEAAELGLLTPERAAAILNPTSTPPAAPTASNEATPKTA